VSVDRKEFEAFLADNQALLERVKKLVKRIDDLQQQQHQLQEELLATREREETTNAAFNVDTRQAEQSIRQARKTIAHLMEESDRRISQ